MKTLWGRWVARLSLAAALLVAWTGARQGVATGAPPRRKRATCKPQPLEVRHQERYLRGGGNRRVLNARFAAYSDQNFRASGSVNVNWVVPEDALARLVALASSGAPCREQPPVRDSRRAKARCESIEVVSLDRRCRERVKSHAVEKKKLWAVFPDMERGLRLCGGSSGVRPDYVADRGTNRHQLEAMARRRAGQTELRSRFPGPGSEARSGGLRRGRWRYGVIGVGHSWAIARWRGKQGKLQLVTTLNAVKISLLGVRGGQIYYRDEVGCSPQDLVWRLPVTGGAPSWVPPFDQRPGLRRTGCVGGVQLARDRESGKLGYLPDSPCRR